MLIEFSVENYKSIKDEITLSLAATSAKDHVDTHVIDSTEFQGVRKTRLLRSVGIFGPNAAGKTNLIRALSTMQNIIVNSTDKQGELPIKPFLFCLESRNKPTAFQVIGIVDQMRFQYGFSTTQNVVIDEWLYTWPKGRRQHWFYRNTDSETGVVNCKFGEKLAGDKEVWRRATRPNALLLSTAERLNSEQLKPIYDWFRKKLRFGGIGGWLDHYSIEWCKENRKDEIVNFLRKADFVIDDISISEKKLSQEDLPDHMPNEMKNRFLSNLPNLVEVNTKHKFQNGQSIELSLREESHGTQKIFSFAAPWIDTLEKGHVIVYDELHEHLHPILLRFLINQFHKPQISKSNAQLIFTTHETSVLSQEILRRDQVWFCERNSKQETELFPLTDFSPRRHHENLARAYLGGRYGALPFPGYIQ